jgi:Ala-tRNA(Pro) deacylase
MTVALALLKFLSDRNVAYELVPHKPTMSAIRSAEACHISSDRVAKGVVLRDRDGYWLAIVPASRRILLSDLKKELGEDVDLATEQEIGQMFHDCHRGAIPPVGPCYGLDVIVDDSIDQLSELYFEAGDHATLVRMSRAEFARLNGPTRHGSFTVHA